MTQKTSFKSRMKQAFSFFRSDLRACTPLLVVFGLISAVTVVICYTICVVLGEDMTFTGILHDIEDIINWTKTQDFANPDKIILSGQSMGGYAAATAAPIVNPYALILMCPGAGMWFGCKDRAEAMEAKGITKADIEGLTFPTSFNHDLFNYEPFSSAEGYNGPVLLIRGTADDLVDDATCHRYESLYNGKCNYKTIEGANHNFASAFARAELDKLMLEFLTPLK